MELLGVFVLTLFTVLLAVLIAGAIIGAGMIGMTGFVEIHGESRSSTEGQ